MRADTATDVSDADLVAALRSGDRTAMAAIYDRHADALYAFAVRTLGSPHDAADACHDAFVIALQRIDQLRDPARLRPWLYAIVRNECTRIGRARSRVEPVSPGGPHGTGVGSAAAALERVGPDPSAATPRPGGDDPVGDMAVRTADAAVLRDALAGLDPRDRSLFALQAVEGLAGRDLADAAGIPARQLGQANARMRDRLERSIVSLLVSRHGRRDCPELGTILAPWDGQLTVLLRKRVSRHIDDCETCTSRRAALVLPIRSALSAPLPFVAAPADLRAQVLRGVGVGGDGTPPGSHEHWPGGFPPRPASERLTRGRRGLAAVGAVVAVILAVAAVVVGATAGTDGDVSAVLTSAPLSTTSTTVPPSTTTTASRPPTIAPPTTTTTAPPTTTGEPAPETSVPSVEPDPDTEDPEPEVTEDPEPVVDPPPPGDDAPDPPTGDPPAPEEDPDSSTPGPMVEVVRRPPALVRAGCPGPTVGAVAAATSGEGLVVELLIEGVGQPRAVAMAAAGGGWTAPVGPFDAPGTLTGRVRVTDAEGRTATSDAFTVPVGTSAG